MYLKMPCSQLMFSLIVFSFALCHFRPPVLHSTATKKYKNEIKLQPYVTHEAIVQ